MKKTNRSTTPMIIAALTVMLSLFISGTGRIVTAGPARGAAPQPSSLNRGNTRYPFLSRYAIDLTRLARRGKLVAAIGHKSEVNQVARMLFEDALRNPVLIGEAGNNSASNKVAQALALKIASNDIPEKLRGKRVFSLNLDALVAGAKIPAQFVSRLANSLAEAANTRGQVILFIDQLHQFVGTYANQAASTAIREALKDGQLRIIGAATPEAYAQYIAGDESLTKLFRTIRIGDDIAMSSDSSNSADAADDA